MSPQVVLKSPEEATVDDVHLIKDDTDNPSDLTDDQVKRLKSVPEVKLKVLGEEEDPIDSLKGKELDEQVKASGFSVSNASADDKRQALKELRDDQEGGSS